MELRLRTLWRFQCDLAPVDDEAQICSVPPNIPPAQEPDALHAPRPARRASPLRWRAAAQESAPAPSAPPPIGERTYDISAVEVRPRITNRADAARVAEEEFAKVIGPEGGRGSLTLRFVINRDGTTSRAAVVPPTGNPRLDAAALTALRAMRFTPAQLNRKKVAVLVELPLSYDVPPRKRWGLRRLLPPYW